MGVKPITFFPPYLVFNSDTITALKAQGFTHMSASTSTDLPPYNSDPETNLWRFPAGAALSDLFFNPNTNEQVIEDMVTQHKRDGFAVISMYPQNFLVK